MTNQVTVVSASEEVTAWTRRITLTYKGKQAYVRLYYADDQGYEKGTPDFYGEWSDEERNEFYMWLRDDENLALLDELSAY